MALHGDYEFTAIEFTGSQQNYVSLSMHMAKSNYINYTPRWALDEGETPSFLDEAPTIGVEPPYAPRLSTRLIPPHDESTVSGITLIDTHSVINSLNKNVELHGVVARRNRQTTSIRALICESRDEV